MKKVVLFLLLVSVLNADPYYVKVMTSAVQKQLHSVSYQLDRLGYKKYLRKKSNGYELSVGPFKSTAQANSALLDIQRKIGITSMSIIKKNSVQRKTTHKISAKNRVVQTQPLKYSSYFIGVNIGASSVNNEQDIIAGSIDLDDALADSGMNFGAEFGYYINKNIFMTLNYQLVSLDDIDLNNAYVTLNYEFLRDEVFSPYLGIIGGYSLLDWNTHPIESIENDETSSSLMTGVQVGTTVMLAKNVNLFASYQFWIMDHKTKLENSQGHMQISHNFVNNIAVGVRYRF
ncbi:MAG: outer membrane beta-barrel protein [Campylobacterota bacterium]|nr:outer membrane beta-barrel protein [Campylobacterota bacterium]